MIYLRQSTASQEIPLGQFLDSTDGDTEESGLTIANTDIKLWKSGATTLASKNSGGATYISNGVYYAVLDATDTNTLGSMVIFVHVAGALAVRLECVVLSANVYDSMIAGSDNLQIDVATIWGEALPGSYTTGEAGEIIGNLLDESGIRTSIGMASANLDTQLDAIPTSAEINAEVVDVIRTDLIPDSYPADGSQPTIAQALLAILQFLTEKSVSGTTLTVDKPDGTTAAMTFTLDDGTSPTSITRTT